MINLMLVEDNDIVRQALSEYFKVEEGINLVAVANDGPTAINQLQGNSDIDVLMVDWNMPGMNGLQLTTYVSEQFPLIKTIILTMHGKQDYRDKAKAAGAKGYILKDGEFSELVAAVKDVAEGRVAI